MKQCSIKNCDGISWAKGFCRNHYQKKRTALQRVPEVVKTTQSKSSKEWWQKVKRLQRSL